MARTYFRQPMSVSTKQSKEERGQYFNQIQFKGMCDNKNVDTIDNSTFADLENVYINSQDVLASRPKIKSRDQMGFMEIKDIAAWDDIKLVLGKMVFEGGSLVEPEPDEPDEPIDPVDPNPQDPYVPDDYDQNWVQYVLDDFVYPKTYNYNGKTINYEPTWLKDGMSMNIYDSNNVLQSGLPKNAGTYHIIVTYSKDSQTAGDHENNQLQFVINKRNVTIAPAMDYTTNLYDELYDLDYTVKAGSVLPTDTLCNLASNANKDVAGQYNIDVVNINPNYNVTLQGTWKYNVIIPQPNIRAYFYKKLIQYYDGNQSLNLTGGWGLVNETDVGFLAYRTPSKVGNIGVPDPEGTYDQNESGHPVYVFQINWQNPSQIHIWKVVSSEGWRGPGYISTTDVGFEWVGTRTLNPWDAVMVKGWTMLWEPRPDSPTYEPLGSYSGREFLEQEPFLYIYTGKPLPANFDDLSTYQKQDAIEACWIERKADINWQQWPGVNIGGL